MRLSVALTAALLQHACRLADAVKLHAVTYCDVFDPRLMLPLSTFQRHGITPVVLGLGVETGWGPKAGGAINTVRSFIFNHTEPEDVVIVFDALDVVILAGEAELLRLYTDVERRTGRQIIYNAEADCSSPRKADYPHVDTPWKFLNGGVIIGRGSAMRRLFKNEVPGFIVSADGKPLRHQNWHTNFFLDNQDVAMIDSRCEMTQVVYSVPGIFVSTQNPQVVNEPGGYGLERVGNRIHNLLTNTTPPILHFPGPGHWPEFPHPDRTGTCAAYEVFRTLGHPDLATLMEERGLTRHPGKPFGRAPWKDVCTFYVSPFDYAGIQIGHLGDSVIWWWFAGSYLSLVPLIALVLLCGLLGRRCTSGKSKSGSGAFMPMLRLQMRSFFSKSGKNEWLGGPHSP